MFSYFKFVELFSKKTLLIVTINCERKPFGNTTYKTRSPTKTNFLFEGYKATHS